MAGGHPAGGSEALAELLDEYGEELLPDLKHYYGIDLRDVFVPGSGVTPRFLLAHIKHLPMESAFIAAKRGGQQYRGWDETRYLLAAIVNAIRTLTHIYLSAHVDPKKHRLKAPDPWPIPDLKPVEKKDKPGSFAAIAKSKLAAIKKRKQEGRHPNV